MSLGKVFTIYPGSGKLNCVFSIYCGKSHANYLILDVYFFQSYHRAAALCWHAPSRVYYLIGIPALVYLADYLVGLFVRNSLIENVFFERYGEKGV